MQKNKTQNILASSCGLECNPQQNEMRTDPLHYGADNLWKLG